MLYLRRGQFLVEQVLSNFGIGVEKEIYSSSYFSYHYGYKSLLHIPKRNNNSKLKNIENIIKEKFKNINFMVLFLNISSRGNFVNFVLKDKNNYDDLNNIGIVPIKDSNSFSLNLNDINKTDIPHREIFPKPNLNEFPIPHETLKVLHKTISDFSPIFFCIGFDGRNNELKYDDIHLELYPEKNIFGSEDFINSLENYNICVDPFKRYLLDYKKFSHIKVRIVKDEIKNIKYYRAVNVKIPEFYYE